MTRSVIVVIAAALCWGCSSTGADQRPGANPDKAPPWLCQPDPSGGQWQCERADGASVRPPPKVSSKVAPSPQPERAAAPSPPPQPPSQPPPPPPSQPKAEPPSISTIDASGNAYVVQLMAAAQKADLESYAAEIGVKGLQAARVERDGEIYYVMILGVYEDRASAERAAADRPEALQRFEPWVRSLASLQDAMRRADELAASAGNAANP